MSFSLRNLEERDVEATRALLASIAGEAVAAAPIFEVEALKPSLLAPNAFALVAEDDAAPGTPAGTITILMEQETPQTVIGFLGRLAVADIPERIELALSLVTTALRALEGNLQLCLAEIPSTHLWAQAACEQAGFAACGFLPQKHQGNPRESVMVYARLSDNARNLRLPRPEIIPAARDLGVEALKVHGIIEDVDSREDVATYPTEGDLAFAPIEHAAVETMLQGQVQPQLEIFSALQGGATCLHLPVTETLFMAALDGERVVGVIGYQVDPLDCRVQITHMTAIEGQPQGFMAARLMEMLKEKEPQGLWEVFVSAHAPRMQKTFDQLGFVPCAYVPSFGMAYELRSDAIKMIKLNEGYEGDSSELTAGGRNIFSIIDGIYREHNVGNAILKLLRDLRGFRGLGEGELRRVARLFSQKLYRPGELICEEGSAGRELYVVERGEVEIRTREGNTLLGTLGTGAVIGEIAFLNGEPRTANALSKSATIVRVINRADFDRLIQREVHMGLVFFKNVALDLAEKLKKSTVQARQSS